MLCFFFRLAGSRKARAASRDSVWIQQQWIAPYAGAPVPGATQVRRVVVSDGGSLEQRGGQRIRTYNFLLLNGS